MPHYVYMMASKTRSVIYTGETNDIKRRTVEHKTKRNKGFTQRYNVDRLVYFEEHEHRQQAKIREHQIKKWKRQWKIELIEKMNPEWRDLSEDWE